MTDTPGLARAVGRGLRQCCPACGRGKLFRTYLKQVDTCDVCGAALGDIRADDGPAWLTVLTLGPLLVAVTFFVSFAEIPLWLSLPAATLIVTGAVLLLLPRMKGAFIAALWVAGRKGAGE
ncbi:DUF983 domain-containing protein [Hyphomonas sp.]|uniref:DUF983 domain-containing protein n=1 Tax=Hyphomonas sp. TaxID=87 RepID=UPI0025C0569B|nr:DUF983 domain-containing protein [Hyphomonas sp.]